MLIGPCALTTVGATTVAAVTAAAPRKNFRRVADLDVRDCSVVMGMALLGFPRVSSRHSWSRLGYQPSGQVPYSGTQVVGRGRASHKVRIVSALAYGPWRVAARTQADSMRGRAKSPHSGKISSHRIMLKSYMAAM